MKFSAILFSLLFSVFAWAGVDLNSASQQDLENLPGVGKKMAEAIVAARPFKSVDDLKNVKGIGDAKFDKLKGLVQIGGAAASAAPVAAAPTATAPAAAAHTAKATTASKDKLAVGTTININTASAADLEKLPGVGPVKAKAIVDGRPYATVEDLKKVKGIKDGILAKLKPYIVVR